MNTIPIFDVARPLGLASKGFASRGSVKYARRATIARVAEMERLGNEMMDEGEQPTTADILGLDVLSKLQFYGGRSKYDDDLGIEDAYLGVAYSVREQLLNKFFSTERQWSEKDPKFVYYLSAEFLMGRSLTNAVMNLELDDAYAETIAQTFGAQLEELQDVERDAALGNGGLGRLAACFLDSIASLNLPGWGYGIRYRYGIFRQAIENGKQIEYPDYWLTEGNPWEVRRPDVVYEINFGGRLRDPVKEREMNTKKRDYEKLKAESKAAPEAKAETEAEVEAEAKEGEEEAKAPVFEEDAAMEAYVIPTDCEEESNDKWVGVTKVYAVAYDMPVPGYKTNNCTNLRLWDAAPYTELNLEVFNTGDIEGAYKDKVLAEAITSVLYPNDSTEEGKKLRLQQQYFFCSASLQDVIFRFKEVHEDWKMLPEKAIFQLNDTHPIIAIPEMMRILVDLEGLEWNEAWEITRKCFAYTNHTVMPEALEKWDINVLEAYLPQHVAIIKEINEWWKLQIKAAFPDKEEQEKKIKAMSIIHPNMWNENEILVNMAYLGVVGSKHVNGVAAIHSQIVIDDIFPDFYNYNKEYDATNQPNKFQNKTNGVTPRRWLKFCNPPLADLITETLGTEGWVADCSLLKGLESKATDPEFQAKWRDVKRANKELLASLIFDQTGDEVSLDAMFDIQIKRIHEYKRQMMNIMSIMYRYHQIKATPEAERKDKWVPRVVVMAGKAASAYDKAKRIISLCSSVGKIINNDPDTRDYLRLYFLEDYNVSMAEVLIPGAELSQHISTAGTEASGTSNMKFMMNGCLILGTMDGANVEIAEESGKENMFVFGFDAEEIHTLRKERKDLKTDPRWDELLEEILAGKWGDAEYFNLLVQSVAYPKYIPDVGNDWFLLGNDFASYLDAQDEVDKVYKDQAEWTRRSIIYTATSGKFSSDRTIQQYADEIWDVKPTPVLSDEEFEGLEDVEVNGQD